MIDLHTHSTASDGSYSPTALIAGAVKRGLTAIALTDHDTIGGLEEAALAALEWDIRFIPGVELEIAWNQKGEFHLLGLGINSPTPVFRDAIEELSRRRTERNMEIIEKMNKAGISVSYNDVVAIANNGVPLAGGFDSADSPSNTSFGNRQSFCGHSIGRPHFAAFLAKKRIVKNREQAFRRYLGKGKPFYIPKAGLEFRKAVEAIQESGGIAVLAHPMSLYTAWGRLPDLVKNLKENGLDGIEAWHPNAKVSECKRLEELGRKLGLYITAGSDFHGEGRPDRKLGITAGGKKIEESFLELPSLLGSKLPSL